MSELAESVEKRPKRTKAGAQEVMQAQAAAPAPIEHELALLLARAVQLRNEQVADDIASASLLALFASHDPVSLWIQDKATSFGPTLDDLLQWGTCRGAPREHMEARIFAALAITGAHGEGLHFDVPGEVPTVDAARAIAERVGATSVGVRHLLAVFVYEPETWLLEKLVEWADIRELWATRFRCFVTEQYPGEANRWRALHDEVIARELSIGVKRAKDVARRFVGSDGSSIDSTALLSGLLLEGVTYTDEQYAVVQLVKLLGGSAAIGELLEPGDASGSPELPFSDEVLPIIDRALVFATASRKPPQPNVAPKLHVRHLLCALLTDRRPLLAFELLRRAHRTPEGVLAQLRGWLDDLPADVEDRAARDRIFDELREDIVAGYDNDEAHGPDRLGIDHDVRALAAVLASTKVKPPLSVGLFGDWGTGKSFFMAKLRERIALLARAARAHPDEDSWFCGKAGRVVQIDFNAWHYMDANLWSSLAVRVFDALSNELEAEFAEACLRRLESVKEHQAELATAAGQLRAHEAALADKLAEQRRQREQRTLSFAAYIEVIAADVKREVAAAPAVQAVTERLQLQRTTVETELHLVKADLQTVGGTLQRGWHALRSPVRLATLALVLAVPAIVAAITAAIGHADTATAGSIAALVASLTAACAFVRRGASQLNGMVASALGEVDRIEAKARDKKAHEEVALQRECEALTARIAEIEREQLQLTKRRTEIEVELAALQSGDKTTLKDFILQRASSDDYRKNLGVVAAIHRDFKQLSELLAPSAEPPNVERIVLYIDDLDRCSPQRVVEVLQAIHVILSLPLFVVVVGVDSRWLLDSLTTYYRTQFPSDNTVIDAARPQHYLEKIFQIPFTLLPMSADGYGELVGSLLQPHVGTVHAAPSAADASPRPASNGDGHSASPLTLARRTVRPTDARAPVDLTPRGLRLEPRELEHLRTLSSFVSSPRSAKRLVNLYRIVRAGLDDKALDRLIEGHYKITQLCLALVVGNASVGTKLFHLALSHETGSRAAFTDWCRAPETKENMSARDLATLQALHRCNAYFADWPAVREAVYRVARFSFETGRVLAQHMFDAQPGS